MRFSRIRTVNRAALAAVCVSVVTISLIGGAQAKPKVTPKDVEQEIGRAHV